MTVLNPNPFYEMFYMGLDVRKPSSGGCKLQRRSLLSTFVIHFLKSIISRLSTSKISNF